MHLRHALAVFACVILTNTESVLAAAMSPPTLKQLSPKVDTSTPADPSSDKSRVFKIHAGVSQEYILGPGDVLSVTDTSEDKPSTTISPILPDGTAVISYTGVIQASGMSIRELNDLVNERAKKWYVNPQIMVNLAKQRPTQVYLLGELVHPGLYSSGGSGDSGVASHGNDSSDESQGTGGGEGGGGQGSSALSGLGSQSSLTLSGALQMAGGLKDTADVRHLRVTRLAPKQTFQIDLWKLMIDGDVSEDIVLQPGDVVYVPKGGADYNPSDFGMLVNNRPKVRVIGAVKSPGLLAMAPDDDILSAVAKAGGFEITAVSKFVLLARTNRDGTITQEKVNLSKKNLGDGHSTAHQKIRPGDLIIVRRSPSKMVGAVVGRTVPNLISSVLLYTLLYNQTGTK